MNGWLVYQTISSRIYGKTAFYQSGGAYGFRDQLQDCMGIKLIDEELLKEQIEKCCMHQFVEGDVLHWWHEENKRGIRTKFSDDLLWLPYAVMEYIDFSADYEFLNEKIEYLNGNKLKDDEQEIYNQFFQSDFKESIYRHCIRAIDCSLKFGEHGFPLIGCGDWNDGFSNIGTKGRGESVWLGFFLYDILNRFISICEKLNDKENVSKYEEVKEKLRYNLNTKGWDGRWFKRAITDDGVEIGSMSCDECKIDGISQSWAVISDAADNDKKYLSMQEVENNLIDKENKIIKLFWPAFEKLDINPRLY
jgi:cellobiose phosphorylase